jgi:hypothetical protein
VRGGSGSNSAVRGERPQPRVPIGTRLQPPSSYSNDRDVESPRPEENMPWGFLTQHPYDVFQCLERLGYPVRKR